MANPTVGFGARFARRLDGAAAALQIEARQIAYNEASVIASGDLVKSLTTGYVDLFDAADTRLAGVFIGCMYRDPNLGYFVNRPMWNAISGLASTDIVTAYVLTDPNYVFSIRNSSAVTAITRANIGENADISYVAPNAAGYSKSTLNQASLNTTATLPWRIVGLSDQIGNDNTLGNNIVLVRFNTSDYQSATGLA